MLAWPDGWNGPFVLQEIYDLDDIADMCSQVKKHYLDLMERMVSSCYTKNIIFAALREGYTRVAKEMWYLPHGRDISYWLEKSQWILHIERYIADMQL